MLSRNSLVKRFGIFRSPSATGDDPGPPVPDNLYLQPETGDYYLQPDTGDLYLQPA